MDWNRGLIFVTGVPASPALVLDPPSGDLWLCIKGGAPAECASPGISEGDPLTLFNVDPGQLEVTAVTDAFDCPPNTAVNWSVAAPGKRNTVALTVEPGFTNNVAFNCPVARPP